VAPRPELLQKYVIMYIKMSFFDVMSETQKDLEDNSAGIGFFSKNLVHKNFVRNLMSKLARSTLTSSGTIRVKNYSDEIRVSDLLRLALKALKR
jgi:hypothetical protein